MWIRIQKLRRRGVRELSENRPVILPPSRGGGSRCSVKPAWRVALLTMGHELQAFARSPWPTLDLDRASQKLTPRARPRGLNQSSIRLKALT
ncbi:hypothetical protein RJ641_020074 [Dillenia turbinata]|uniref:Uncharacterized protein n=1 Tax=Dillenia turbinata TaxID=194707 RepID=A0AAN8YW22_9MAGN